MMLSPEEFNEEDSLSVNEAADLFAEKHLENISKDQFLEMAIGIVDRRKELLEEARQGGIQRFDAEFANAIADDSIQKARQQIASEFNSSSLSKSEVEALGKLVDSNIEAIASLYFPAAYKAVEESKAKLTKRYFSLNSKQRKIIAKEKEVKKKIEVLSGQKKNQWALRLWFWKELTSNIIILQIICACGLLAGILIGIQIPNIVGCQKQSFCSFVRLGSKYLF